MSRLARRWRRNRLDPAKQGRADLSGHLRPVTEPGPAAPRIGDPETRHTLSIFDKCYRYTLARECQAAGIYPYFRTISDSEDTVVVMEGERRLMLGSNNYLGLTHHPKVLEAAENALRRYGSGCTGSRFLNGTIDLHCRLESELAEFVGKEDCLVFSTGYMANLGVVSGLVARRDLVLLDKLDHASIVDGANLSSGDIERFNHGDMADLERKLAACSSPDRGRLIMVDGVYSMEGNISAVPDLVELAARYGAALVVDDAHAIGVLGPEGNGTAAHYGLTDRVEIITGTFSKSLASIGGFVAADEPVIHYLRHHSRPLIFSASLPPASSAGTLAALEVLREEPERREQLWANTHRLHRGFRELGFDIGPTKTPIVPVLVGTLEDTFRFWRRLFDAGVFTNPVIPPAVPQSACRLRTSLMATHTPDQIDFALEAFGKIGRELGVI